MKKIFLIFTVAGCFVNAANASAENGQSGDAAASKTCTLDVRVFQFVSDTNAYNSLDGRAEKFFEEAEKAGKLVTFAQMAIRDGQTSSFTDSTQIRYNESLDGDLTMADIGISFEITANVRGDVVNAVSNFRRCVRLDDSVLQIKEGDLHQPVFSVFETRTVFDAKLGKPFVLMARPIRDGSGNPEDYAPKQEELCIVISALN